MKTCSIQIETAKSKTKLNKNTVEILLNELFSLDDRENEIKIKEYADHLGVKISV